MSGGDTHSFKVLVNYIYNNELAFSIMKKVEIETFIRKSVLMKILVDKHFTRQAYDAINHRFYKLMKMGLLMYVRDDDGFNPMVALTNRGAEVLAEAEKLGDIW